ncbi:MAG: DoxX family protein [Bacteroidetes bacterium]|nr:DoxX family protein [Bacteroidota bacterium]
MKNVNVTYWSLTIVFAGLMLWSAIPDLMSTSDAVLIINKQLGYPAYFTPFIGFVKILGVIAILIPGYPRIKEWAYAGFAYDLSAAAYSSYYSERAVGQPVAKTAMIMLIYVVFAIASYVYYHKKLKSDSSANTNRPAMA